MIRTLLSGDKIRWEHVVKRSYDLGLLKRYAAKYGLQWDNGNAEKHVRGQMDAYERKYGSDATNERIRETEDLLKDKSLAGALCRLIDARIRQHTCSTAS